MSERIHKKNSSRERHIPEYLPYIPYLRFGDCIGNGHFSHVYLGKYHNAETVAVKLIERGSAHLIQNEVTLLKALKDKSPHIVQLYEIIQKEETLLVFEYVKSIPIDNFFADVTVSKFRYVVKSVLEALEAAHKLGIVHRDVKLGNIMISSDFKTVKLIDWGCGCFVSDDMSPKAGSRHCRPPEMLMGITDYGTGCDIWAVGIFIMFVLTNMEIPWKAKTSNDTLIRMSEYFGGNELDRIADKLGIRLSERVDEAFADEPEKSLESSFDKNFHFLFDPDLIDLMKTLLNPDLSKRPTAHEALQHPFFKKM